jgi:hypothetical protein
MCLNRLYYEAVLTTKNMKYKMNYDDSEFWLEMNAKVNGNDLCYCPSIRLEYMRNSDEKVRASERNYVQPSTYRLW